jgi:hypothetical protein
VLLGGVILFDGSEDATQSWLYLLTLSTTLVFVGLLIRGARDAWRDGRACQQAIASEVAGSAQRLWPGPPPEPGHDRLRLANLRALSSSRRQHRDPLPITTMYVQIDAGGMVLYATRDQSPMLRIAFFEPGMVDGVDWDGDPASGDLEGESPEDGELEGQELVGPPQVARMTAESTGAAGSPAVA